MSGADTQQLKINYIDGRRRLLIANAAVLAATAALESSQTKRMAAQNALDRSLADRSNIPITLATRYATAVRDGENATTALEAAVEEQRVAAEAEARLLHALAGVI
jgi:hypothetical protein